jgi:hypothetical protein
MQRSDSIKSLAKALVLAKSKMEPPTKDKTNPHFKSKYADLASLKSSYQTALTDAGLSVVSALGLKDTVLTLTTTVVHADTAEFVASDFPIPAGLKAQEIGSAVTYGRRYNISCLLDIVAEDDDDGNAAQAGTTKAPEKVSAPAAAPPVQAPKPTPAPELTQVEILNVQTLAKQKGYTNSAAFAPVLSNILPGVTKASEIPRKDLQVVLDALKAMREKVVA